MTTLDSHDHPLNTPARRFMLTGAPPWTWEFSVEGFPDDVVRDAVATWVYPNREGSYVPGRIPGLVLWGKAGAGKTGLAAAALGTLALASFGKRFYWNMAAMWKPGDDNVPALPSPCWFLSWSRHLAVERGHHDPTAMPWHEVLEQRISALVLDDVDVEAGTTFRESHLLDHLEWSYYAPGRALIITCNEDPERWEQVFGSRVADRLTDPHRFTIVNVRGETRRG